MNDCRDGGNIRDDRTVRTGYRSACRFSGKFGENDGGKDQDRSRVTFESQDFMEEQPGKQGGEYRFQREDQADFLRCGIALGDGLDNEAVCTANQSQTEDGAPLRGGGGQGRRF